MTRLLIMLTASLTLLLTSGLSYAKDSKTTPLGKIHADIVEDFPQIPHISRTELQARLALEPNNLVILDTRPAKEFNVSHIKGAIQVDPKIEAKQFQTLFGPQVFSKTVIVYCSVGRRSSRLGGRLTNTIMQSGAQKLYNLEGGVFGWHNAGYELQNTSGVTKHIHPYNPFWGRLIENKKQIRYSPKE